jgi:hypothetical protein
MFSTDPLTRRIPTGSYPCGTFYETFDRIQLEECHSGTACCRQTDDMRTRITYKSLSLILLTNRTLLTH